MAVSPSGTLVATQSMELRYVRESGAVNPEFMLQVRNAARIRPPDPATAATSREISTLRPLRGDGGRIAVHGGEFERDQAVDRGAAHARQLVKRGVRNAFNASHWDGVSS